MRTLPPPLPTSTALRLILDLHLISTPPLIPLPPPSSTSTAPPPKFTVRSLILNPHLSTLPPPIPIPPLVSTSTALPPTLDPHLITPPSSVPQLHTLPNPH